MMNGSHQLIAAANALKTTTTTSNTNSASYASPQTIIRRELVVAARFADLLNQLLDACDLR